jgi:hypothetical protein
VFEDAGSEDEAEGVPAESKAARLLPVDEVTVDTLMPVFPKQVPVSGKLNR